MGQLGSTHSSRGAPVFHVPSHRLIISRWAHMAKSKVKRANCVSMATSMTPHFKTNSTDSACASA